MTSIEELNPELKGIGNYEFGSRSLNGLSIGGERTEGDDWVDGSTYAGAQWQNYMRDVARDYDTSQFSNPPSRVLAENGSDN